MLSCEALVTRLSTERDAGIVGVSLIPNDACKSCANGRGCGMALALTRSRGRSLNDLKASDINVSSQGTLELPISQADPGLRVGQKVSLTANSTALVMFSALAYLLPLFSGVLLAAVAVSLSGEQAANVAAILGLLAGLMIGFAPAKVLSRQLASQFIDTLRVEPLTNADRAS